MRILLVMFLAVPALVMAVSPVALVGIPLDQPGNQARFNEIIGELDVLTIKPGSFARVAASAFDLEVMSEAGLTFNILNQDMESTFSFPDKSLHYGAYHTWSENIAFIDSLRLLYPDVISAKWSIGQSLEGREIWAFRISDNPDIDENEPEILIDGAHHAREIMSSEFPIMFAEYLARGYGSDTEISWLLNNRELYIVPIVNPDGFIYNEMTNPDGGGMWRKNRRDNGDGTFGVDLNRNYTYQWGYDDNGSSPTTSALTYRGPSAGSEPETQVMMDFINSRNFRTHDSVHTFSNVVIYPWSYVDAPAPDNAVLASMSNEMTRYNGYLPGQGSQILYFTNGGARDWAYGATNEHAKVFSFTTEIGGYGDGFWPSEARRDELFQENIWPHIYLMRAAGAFVAVHSPVVTPDPAKTIDPGQSGMLTFMVQNQAASTTSAPLTITLSSDDPWLYLGQYERSIAALSPQGFDDLTGNPIPFNVHPDCPSGHLTDVLITVPMPEGTRTFTLTFLIGVGQSLLVDNMEGDTSNWVFDDTWGQTTSQSHGFGGTSLTDSPDGSYSNEQSSAATLVGSFYATAISFWHLHVIEHGYDFGYLQVRPLGGDWTNVGSYSGFLGGWTQVTVTLDQYLGQKLEIRFLLETDIGVVNDGWYIDDVEIFGQSNSNLAPDIPLPLSSAGVDSSQILRVAAGPDPEGSQVVCGFRLYHRIAGLWKLMAESDDIPTVAEEASWTTPSLPDGEYKWRAWAGDGEVRSDLSADLVFLIDHVSAVDQIALDGPTFRILSVKDGRVRLQLSLDNGTDVEVAIYDVRGARIQSLHRGWLDGGLRVLIWDGCDRAGRNAASGVYLAQARVGKRVLTNRLVLVR
ncbi:MAG: hypothetical protein KAH56_01635 [Candidatus Krumholzibacteria bacterium]|nr:hypothetical protein [Candidatus Krumholzibacteria bacterium]